MKTFLVAFMIACCSFVSPKPALADEAAGCACGRSYISNKKCCHKCPCACDCCTANCGDDVPDLVKMLVPIAVPVWCAMKASLEESEAFTPAE